MKTKTIEVYEYKELEAKAKERARNWLLQGHDFEFEWDCIKDDAKNIGLELTEWDYGRYCRGALLLDFTQVLASIMKDHGEACETFKTAKEYQKKYSKLSEEQILNGEEEEIREDFLKDILEDYRIQADNQYEYIQSEEAIEDAMEANDYEFTKDGKRI